MVANEDVTPVAIAYHSDLRGRSADRPAAAHTKSDYARSGERRSFPLTGGKGASCVIRHTVPRYRGTFRARSRCESGFAMLSEWDWSVHLIVNPRHWLIYGTT